MKIWKKVGKLKENSNYCLKDNLDNFEINKVYISNFLKILWNYPEAIFYILNNTEKDIIEHNLASFFMNNFFNNYIRGISLENNLLFVITMMIKQEVDNFKEEPQIDNFLENTKASFLLKEMINFFDIKFYFNSITFHLVEKIENDFYSKIFSFNLQNIYKDLKAYIKKESTKSFKKKHKSIEDICTQFVNMKLSEQNMNNFENIKNTNELTNQQEINIEQSFLENTASITTKELEVLIQEAEKNNKEDLKNYYINLKNNLKDKNENDIYDNISFEEFSSDKDINLNYLLYLYQNNFKNAILLINIFLEDLLKCKHLVPDSIKIICKIISILIKNKYKNLPKHLQNSFISKFFVDILLIPSLEKLKFGSLIISSHTQDNINIIIHILKNIFYGKLFQINSILPDGEDEKYFIIFNKYIIKSMEKILLFYERICDTSLPPFINNYLNNSLTPSYSYDYFTENPEEIYANISICFNLDNVFNLIQPIKNGEKEFFSSQNKNNCNLKVFFNKLKSEDKFNELLKLDNNNNKNNNQNNNNIKKDDNKIPLNKSLKKPLKIVPTINYYIINEMQVSDNYKNIFLINNDISGYYIDIKKLQKEKKLKENEKNLIKFKNYFIDTLKNFKLLKKSLFKNTESLYSIMSQIKGYLQFPLNNNIMRVQCDINLVLDYMNKIPEEYQKNNFEKLFEEFNQDINKSIEEIDFDKLIILKKNAEEFDKIIHFYRIERKKIDNINTNITLKKFIEESFYPIELKFDYFENDKEFKIKKSNKKFRPQKDNDKIEFIKNDKILVKTVASFIRYFPDLNIYKNLIDVSPFQIIIELEINKKLLEYFNLIKSAFIQENNCTEEEYNKIYDLKMKKYILDKLYKKIYPRELEADDLLFFKKTIQLSWVNPKMFIKDDCVSSEAFENLLPGILKSFKLLNFSKNPFDKFTHIKTIFQLIGNIVKYNYEGEGEKKEIGAEDITPYLNYILIRACPVKIFSDIKFIKLFLQDEGNMEYDLINVESMCKKILESTYKDYYLSESEYIEKCNSVLDNTKDIEEERFEEIMGRYESIA